MSNNANEGTFGMTVLDIYSEAGQDFPQHPNIVLLMAGINNIIQGRNASIAYELVSNITDKLVANLPNAVIFVANLIPVSRMDWDVQRQTFNRNLDPLLAAKRDAGKKVMGVDMDAVNGATDLSSDGLHPNDGGYLKISKAWLNALQQANALGWIHNRTTLESAGHSHPSSNSVKSSGSSLREHGMLVAVMTMMLATASYLT